MFIGHFAVGFASKRAAGRVSLGWLLLAPLLVDLLWPVFLLLGWERVQIVPGATAMTPLAFEWYPWSHSLVMMILWALVFATIVLGATHDWVATVVVFGAVQSHWALDWVTHRPDMPIWPFGEKYGLGLWNSVAGTVGVELALFAAGVWLYARGTRPRDAIGRWGWRGMIVLLLAIYAGNVAGPPPPSVGAIAGLALLLWLFPVLAWWVDRHREVIEPAGGGGLSTVDATG